MTPEQISQAKMVLRRNLEQSRDWIVLNFTMETLTVWAADDAELRQWLAPRRDALRSDPRKSVARRAENFARQLA